MRFDWAERRLSALFGSYSRVVCKCPAPFILTPLLLTVGLLSGFLRDDFLLKDDLSLYTPTTARAHDELERVGELFRLPESDPFYAERRLDMLRVGYVIVSGVADEENVLTRRALNAAAKLWTRIKAMTVYVDERAFNYSSTCIRAEPFDAEHPDGFCVANPLIELYLRREAKLLDGLDVFQSLKYPTTAAGMFVGQMLGGVQVDERHNVQSARALLLPYQLQHRTRGGAAVAERWEAALAERVGRFRSSRITASCMTSETLGAEAARDRDTLLLLLPPLALAVLAFTVACCCVGSVVRSRPLLAVGGVMSAGMAIGSAIGLLLLLDAPFTTVAYSMPFIVFSIGVDNVFILLSAWRKTPTDDSFEQRIGLTFREAGVSITVTSLTDALSFAIGCTSTFPSVRIFCMYAAVAVAFVFAYQITFFAGILVLTSRREVGNRHCITFKRVLAPVFPADVDAAVASKDASFENNHVVSRFFRSTYADFLMKPTVRLGVAVAFCVYLYAAVRGCANIELGLAPAELLPDDSYGQRTVQLYEQYFSDYGPYLHVVIDGLDDDSAPWLTIGRVVDAFEHTEFTEYADSWLRVFLAFVRAGDLRLTARSFPHLLRRVFLRSPAYARFERDVRFDGSRLRATRVPVRLRHMGAANHSRAMHVLRRIADAARPRVHVYADLFQFAEQYDAVLPGTLTSMVAAAGTVIAVSLALIPRPTAALWVCATIASIIAGTVGFMTFLDVHLDFVSMVTIVMSIGFCVDFSAHMAYHYSKGEKLSSSERLRQSLYTAGTPILQGGASTVLGVAFMVFVRSYVYRSFLKTVVLVILLGTFHGLVVLPVLLITLDCSSHDDCGADAVSTGGGKLTPSSQPPHGDAIARPLQLEPAFAATQHWQAAAEVRPPYSVSSYGFYDEFAK